VNVFGSNVFASDVFASNLLGGSAVAAASGKLQAVHLLLDEGWVETTYRVPARARATLPARRRRDSVEAEADLGPIRAPPRAVLPAALPEIEALSDPIFRPELIHPPAPAEEKIQEILDIWPTGRVASKRFAVRVRFPGVMPARAREMATHVAKCRGRAFLGVRRQQVTARRRERFSG